MQDEDQHTRVITYIHILQNTCCLVAVPLLLSLSPTSKLLFFWKITLFRVSPLLREKGKIQSLGVSLLQETNAIA